MSKDDKRRYTILKDDRMYRGLLLLSLPVMFNNLIKTIHDIVDMFFVSRLPGITSEAISSISVTFPVFFIFISLGMGLSIGGSALISQSLGAYLEEDSKKYTNNLVFLSVLIGISLMIIGYIAAPFIFKYMGAEGFVLENATAYLRIRTFELPIMFIFYAYSSIKRSEGNNVSPMIIGVITIVLNIILSPIFIMVLKQGVLGAAYATLLAQIITLPVILYLLFKPQRSLFFDFKYCIYNKGYSDKIIKYSAPAAIGQAITAVGFIVLNSFLLEYGEQTVAAFSVGNRLSSIILHPVMAMGGVLSAYIGQNIGALQVIRAKQAFNKAMVLSITLMGTLALIVLPFRNILIGLFLSGDKVAYNLASTYMVYLLLGLPLMGIFQTFIGAFNGDGRTTFTFIVNVVRLWIIRIPLIWYFTYYTSIGSSGIWFAMLISNVIISVIGFILYKQLKFEPKIDVL